MSRSRKGKNLGYSCPCCKPWKHGIEDRYRPSERRRLQDDIREELQALALEPHFELEEERDAEVDLAWYCHFYGPCEHCLARRAEECDDWP